jgi:hypothetical protein
MFFTSSAFMVGVFVGAFFVELTLQVYRIYHHLKIQKAIRDQLHTSAANYTQVLGSLAVSQAINKSHTKAWHNASDRTEKKTGANYGVDIKHNSYDRYLAKKKSTTLKTQSSQQIPLQGNKTKYYSLITQNNDCITNC